MFTGGGEGVACAVFWGWVGFERQGCGGGDWWWKRCLPLLCQTVIRCVSIEAAGSPVVSGKAAVFLSSIMAYGPVITTLANTR